MIAQANIRCAVCGGELVVDTKQMQAKCSQCGLLYPLESLRKMAEGSREKQNLPAQLDAQKVAMPLGAIQESTHREYVQEVPKALSVPAFAKPSASAAAAAICPGSRIGHSVTAACSGDYLSSQPSAIENSDSGAKVTQLPAIEKWKTSAPLSVFGLLVYAAINMTVGLLFSNQLWAVVCTTVVIPLVFAVYAIAVYPSLMRAKPILKSPKAISFCNFFAGGPIFGSIWNYKLTQNKERNYQSPRRGISHIVHASCSLVVALMGIALIFLAMMLPVMPSGLKVGDTVSYGTYKGEPLEWQVLEFDGDKALLVTKNIIAIKVHYAGTWRASKIRGWLEGDFKQSFNYVENVHILNTFRSATNTTDSVFLLSMDEAEKYFSSDEARCAKAMNISDDEIAETARWCVEKKIKVGGKELSYSEWVDALEREYQSGRNTTWGLCSFHNDGLCSFCVSNDGSLYTPESEQPKRYTNGVHAPFGIRPAMWVTR
ncbi:MAG: DUF6273 domain-containing protein [Coriobacteriales bacterium]|jgi:hypothetical protein|nr:DUF6273 domain-containing protein [Coriobacteriales bacterium]